MPVSLDYIVVGSGLTGAVIARRLHDAGREVIVIERRPEVGGNIRDAIHERTGTRYGLYGPHYFRTNSQRVWDFVNQFCRWRPWEARLRTRVDGQLERWPVAAEYIRRVIGDHWQPHLMEKCKDCGGEGGKNRLTRGNYHDYSWWECPLCKGTGRVPGTNPAQFEIACLQQMPAFVYERFVKGYTEKQWGVPAHTLSASLAGRFAVAPDDDDRLKTHRWQALPEPGYSEFAEALLDGIPVARPHDWLQHRDRWWARKMMVFTGPVDAYYQHCHGRLKYRGQLRETFTAAHTTQDYIQVNEPSPGVPWIRSIEWRHLGYPVPGGGPVLVTRETPHTPLHAEHYEYPFPDLENAALYGKYRQMARREGRVIFAGRLGRYQYLDMDQAIAAALTVADKLLENK